MKFALTELLIAGGIFLGMLAGQMWGRRLGNRRLGREPGELKSGAIEGAVFGLLGLFLAFTFSGAGARFDARRHLIIEEANAIGTAWLRIDLLPADRQPHVRDLFRQYVDARLEAYRAPSDTARVDAATARYTAIQQDIWSAAVTGTSGQLEASMLLLPALNEMIDITTTRTAATRIHPPLPLFVMVGVLALLGALIAGYGMAGSKNRGRFYMVGFAAAMALALYVIIDLEFPRLGFIRVDAFDEILVDVRNSMK